MHKRSKIDRRKLLLQSSPPSFMFKEESAKSYDQARFPGKPSAAEAFCSGGVKKSPPELYQFLAGMAPPNMLSFDTHLDIGAAPRYNCSNFIANR